MIYSIIMTNSPESWSSSLTSPLAENNGGEREFEALRQSVEKGHFKRRENDCPLMYPQWDFKKSYCSLLHLADWVGKDGGSYGQLKIFFTRVFDVTSQFCQSIIYSISNYLLKILIWRPLEKYDAVILMPRSVTVAVYSCILLYFVYKQKVSSKPVNPSTSVTSAQTTDLPSDTLLHLPVSPLWHSEYETTPRQHQPRGAE